jgi:chemotaxis protein methyltransferase CheR
MRRSLSDSLLLDLSGFVAARLGLHFPEERWADLERGVAAAARELGLPDAESCARWLLSASLTRTHIEVLASHLTIGETYFFREKDSLDVLEQQIVPELLRSRPGGERHLRIWSAGCCTGEEPYSIAMLLDRLIADDAGWNVTILATDINPKFLRKAAAGVYGEWSFRTTPAWIRERYFKQRKDGRFELHSQIRSRVTFSYLNLADDVYPSLVNNTNAMDLIFCRNVLMYFTAERAKEVSRNLYRSLVDGGWLVVSPTETSNILFSSFSAVQFPGVVLYRRTAGAERGAVVMGHQAPAFATQPETLTFDVPLLAPEPAIAEPLRVVLPGGAPEQPGVVVASGSGEEPAPKREDGHALSANARRSANEGRLADAIEWCEKAIAADKMNPAHHYLLATVRQEQGQTEAAAQSLMRTLYLDPDFVLAHFGLANMELSLGRRREARRHFANALATLRAHTHDEILPESEGLTAGRLAEIITSVLASLPRAGDDTGVRNTAA